MQFGVTLDDLPILFVYLIVAIGGLAFAIAFYTDHLENKKRFQNTRSQKTS